ncbi:MAG: SDR family NAD(P)-dependent oxidoreductase [Bacteroidota bacterium]
MSPFENKTVIITGGTDGIGAAMALELCGRGANVTILGRSPEKANVVIKASTKLNGRIRAFTADFSVMRNVERTVQDLMVDIDKVDFLVHGVGILLPRNENTVEGLEKNFAVSYLSRFLLNEILFDNGRFKGDTKLLNIAASAPEVPKFAQMDFDDIDKVKARTGTKGHGQAQLANDIYTIIAADRYGLVSISYGPGSVETNIRREFPKLARMLMKPFFKPRKPHEVASQLAMILGDGEHSSARPYFYNKIGAFGPSEFLMDSSRQEDLLGVTLELIENAMAKDI